MIRRQLATLFLAAIISNAAAAQSPSSGTVAEADSFRLHKFAQPIGWEHYTIDRDSGTLRLRSSFLFTDRGSKVPLETSAHFRNDLTPISFAIKGRVARGAGIDASVDVVNGNASVRVDTIRKSSRVAGPFFTIDGYAPVAMQQELMRYWESHGRPHSLHILPSGTITISPRGIDTVTVGGRRVPLRRFAVDGIIWGRETIWLDARSQLAALVSIDAEFDHFEATRLEYEASLGTLTARAGADATRALAALARATSADTGDFALVGATVIDATGSAPIPNATVLVTRGRIAAVGPRSSITIPKGAKRIDVAGKYVVPGLWDMHAHYEQAEWGPIYLASGVTTVRDVGNELDFIAAIRNEIAAGRGLGPRILLAGLIDGPGPIALGVQQAATPAEGEQLVDQYHAARFDQIKIYSSVKLPVLAAIARRAHALGMTVTGHVPEGISTRTASTRAWIRSTTSTTSRR